MKKINWKKYGKYSYPLNDDVCCWYQALIWYSEDQSIYADILEYEHKEKKNWELEIQIPEELSLIKQTINVKAFAYIKLDFKQIERDARKIIEALADKKGK